MENEPGIASPERGSPAVPSGVPHFLLLPSQSMTGFSNPSVYEGVEEMVVEPMRCGEPYSGLENSEEDGVQGRTESDERAEETQAAARLNFLEAGVTLTRPASWACGPHGRATCVKQLVFLLYYRRYPEFLVIFERGAPPSHLAPGPQTLEPAPPHKEHMAKNGCASKNERLLCRT